MSNLPNMSSCDIKIVCSAASPSESAKCEYEPGELAAQARPPQFLLHVQSPMHLGGPDDRAKPSTSPLRTEQRYVLRPTDRI
eukprot:6202049-Pleurochrysis_carterae.AAC.2